MLIAIVIVCVVVVVAALALVMRARVGSPAARSARGSTGNAQPRGPVTPAPPSAPRAQPDDSPAGAASAPVRERSPAKAAVSAVLAEADQSAPRSPTTSTIDTVVGSGIQGYFGDGGNSWEARLSAPNGLATDAGGNLYVADSGNHCVRKVTPAGLISTVVGTGHSGYSGDGGPAARAQLSSPDGLCVDNAGNLYIADSWNHCVRRVDVAGTISTVAGNGEEGFSGDGGPAIHARMCKPMSVTVDTEGNLYVADTWNHVVRWITTDGTITTIIGSGREGSSGNGGPAGRARLGHPCAIVLDTAGNIFVADSLHHVVRRVGHTGKISSFAGSGFDGCTGDGDHSRRSRLSGPNAISLDARGNLYIADYGNHNIRRVHRRGIISTTAGTGEQGMAGDGGPALRAVLSVPSGLCIDASGNLFISDYGNHCVRRIKIGAGPAPRGPRPEWLAGIEPDEEVVVDESPRAKPMMVETAFGGGGDGFDGDGGSATDAKMRTPSGLAYDALGNLYIADARDHRVRKVDIDGIITTVAGNGTAGRTGDSANATETTIGVPSAVGSDDAGNLYIFDCARSAVLRVDTGGSISTFAVLADGDGDGEGHTTPAPGDGPPASILPGDPSGPDVVPPSDGGESHQSPDDRGAEIAADDDVRETSVEAAGAIPGAASGAASGAGERAQVHDEGGIDGEAARDVVEHSGGLIVEADGTVIVADTTHHCVLRIVSGGKVTVVAGTGEPGFSGDGDVAPSARLDHPNGIALGPQGDLYIADTANHRIRRVGTDGTITTVAGSGTAGYSPDGEPAAQALLNSPTGIAFDGHGRLYITEAAGNRIRRVDFEGMITTVAGTGEPGFSGDGELATHAMFSDPSGLVFDDDGNLYIADSANHCVRKVNMVTDTLVGDSRGGQGPARARPVQHIFMYAGKGERGYAGDGHEAAIANLYNPSGLVIDANGQLFIADTDNHCVRQVDVNGFIFTVAGNGTDGYDGDSGAAEYARMKGPIGLAFNSSGELYIADGPNHRIRLVDRTGKIHTIAGTGVQGYSGDEGPAVFARLGTPSGLAIDDYDALYIADFWNHRIRRISSSGTISTVAGTGVAGFGGDGGLATRAKIRGPLDVAFDSRGNLYIAESTNHRIRKIDTSGVISTVAGTGKRGFSGDGGPARDAMLDYPSGVVVDSLDNLFISDGLNHRVRTVDPMGTITTVVGSGDEGSSPDGVPALEAKIKNPKGLAIGPSGDLFIADQHNHCVRRVC